MKLLLDHCVPHALAALFAGHDVSTVSDMGLDRLKNGELMGAATRAGFVVLITVDQNSRYQQNLAKLPLAVIVLRSESNGVHQLAKLAPLVQEALRTPAPRRFIEPPL